MVAMASTLAETGGGPNDCREPVPGRVSQSLLLSGRVLATALTSVAEQLEEDWSERHRPTHRPYTGGGAWAVARMVSGASVRPRGDANAPVSFPARHAFSSAAALDPARHAIHRRTLNLPPPLA
jgi:hypothetical protein